MNMGYLGFFFFFFFSINIESYVAIKINFKTKKLNVLIRWLCNEMCSFRTNYVMLRNFSRRQYTEFILEYKAYIGVLVVYAKYKTNRMNRKMRC